MDLAFVESLSAASAATLADWQPGDAWLGGGTWLFSEPQPELRRLFDLHAFGWDSITATNAGLEIAATCRLTELADFVPPPHWHASHVIRSCCESLLGSFKIWNEATVGGNICLSLPAGPMTSLASSLDGTCEIWHADGTRNHIPAVEFVTGNRTNVLSPGSLLRAITLPERTLRARAAFRQVSRTPLGRSAALVIGTRDPEDDSTTFTVTAAVTRPLQIKLDHVPSTDELLEALADADPAAAYFDDPHGSPEWRAHLTRLLLTQTLEELA
jgi:CO/xanthine dehydrogenase FAD-binding subunit